MDVLPPPETTVDEVPAVVPPADVDVSPPVDGVVPSPADGAEVVVIGRGLTVGRPLGLLLTRKQENATVTLTHTGTRDLLAHTKRADIVVAAIGKSHFLKAEMIKEGAAIIDVGISRTDAGLLGDVDPGVMNVASFVAPMPGGVGPMTRAMLLMNVVDACER